MIACPNCEREQEIKKTFDATFCKCGETRTFFKMVCIYCHHCIKKYEKNECIRCQLIKKYSKLKPKPDKIEAFDTLTFEILDVNYCTGHWFHQICCDAICEDCKDKSCACYGISHCCCSTGPVYDNGGKE